MLKFTKIKSNFVQHRNTLVRYTAFANFSGTFRTYSLWSYKLVSHKIYLANTTLNNYRAPWWKSVQQHMIGLPLLGPKFVLNEPVIAKCTWNNSLVLVFFTNDPLFKSHIPIYYYKKKTNRAKHAHFYASGRVPIYLNINKNYRFFNPPK